jgi:hypothetical protein
LFKVIFNLIDIPQFINHGWIPVNSTSNIILTENLLSTLDIVESNITNLTNLAVRTPLISNNQRPIILPIRLNPKFKNVFGIEFHVIFILWIRFLFQGLNLPKTFILLITYRSVRNSSGTLFSLLDHQRSSIIEIKINTNITVIYRYEDKIEQLIFHNKIFLPNDGL